ncbi:hypothetical protein ColKHC_12274 [Colletotrichum higginsianum]|nr:hypothetical protein ColKHC_12274 [Colletotrichum higginsianum]
MFFKFFTDIVNGVNRNLLEISRELQVVIRFWSLQQSLKEKLADEIRGVNERKRVLKNDDARLQLRKEQNNRRRAGLATVMIARLSETGSGTVLHGSANKSSLTRQDGLWSRHSVQWYVDAEPVRFRFHIAADASSRGPLE